MATLWDFVAGSLTGAVFISVIHGLSRFDGALALTALSLIGGFALVWTMVAALTIYHD